MTAQARAELGYDATTRLEVEDQFQLVLKFSEIAVRSDAKATLEALSHPEDVAERAQMIGCVEKLLNTLGYLSAAAAAGWQGGFHRLLQATHSIRVERVSGGTKELFRDVPACMACGRKEHLCRVSTGPCWHLQSRELEGLDKCISGMGEIPQ